MIELKDLLSRFQHLVNSGEIRKESIRSILSEVLNIQIESDKINIKNNIIYLDIEPIYKNEILIKKEKIFEKLSSVLGKKSPSDLR